MSKEKSTEQKKKAKQKKQTAVKVYIYHYSVRIKMSETKTGDGPFDIRSHGILTAPRKIITPLDYECFKAEVLDKIINNFKSKAPCGNYNLEYFLVISLSFLHEASIIMSIDEKKEMQLR